jgi:tetratricopeptide (TPR) repeat protein
MSSGVVVRSLAWMIGLLSLLMAAGRLRAQDPADDTAGVVVPGDDGEAVATAREHFKRGTEYYSEGDFRAALLEFERAHALRHSFRLLYNLGQVCYELRDYAGAERYFRAYLVEGEDEITPERREEVKRELDRLRQRVAGRAHPHR